MSKITLTYKELRLAKRVPLTISRGTSTHSELLWVTFAADGQEGWGEAVGFSVDGHVQNLEQLKAGATAAASLLRDRDPSDRPGIEAALLAEKVPSALRSAVDQAWWDWHGRATGNPVWKLWGFDPRKAPVTSVTVGISSPEAARARVRKWLELGDLRAFKIKLGSPAGIRADQEMFSAVREVLPAGVKVSVDANGGWSMEDAIVMAQWLAARGLDHLEQPLSRGREHEVRQVRAAASLPVILDESVMTSGDIEPLVKLGALDGINIKLMKCGGPSEALRLVEKARSFNLKILVGCYGNTALANTAGATLGPVVDYLDLDSHLNLKDDPFVGARLEAGHFVLPEAPGFGISHEHHT